MMTMTQKNNQGIQVEHDFCRLAKQKGYKVTSASRDENINRHIDFYLEKSGKKVSVDVKSMKRLQRSQSIQDDWHTIEFIAVSPASVITKYNDKPFNPLSPNFSLGSGRAGWVYSEATYIVFELKHSYVFVTPNNLFEFCIQHVNFHKTALSSAEAKYVVYSRPNRGDLFTFIHKKDLCHMAEATWHKSE